MIERLGPEFSPRVLLVGGAVRDLLLGGEPADLDLVVEGPIEPVIAALGGSPHSHERFSTATVEIDGGTLDLAQARTELYAQPGALPTVSPSGIVDDLGRRDFTVNALAVPLTGADAGSLISFPGALDDLARRRLAVLHPLSFTDDPTRLLRLARYRARLGFEIAAETRALAARAVDGSALETVSGTRIGNELRLLASEPDPVAALAAVAELGLDTAIAPGFGLGPDGAELLRAALSVLPPDGRRDLLALAAACRSVPAQQLQTVLDRLGFTASERDSVLEAATSSTRLAAGLSEAARPSEIADAVGAAGPEALALAYSSAGADGVPRPDAARANALRWITDLRYIRPAITGDDLITAGIAPGPAIGAGLKAARAALLDGDVTSRDQQLEVALAAARRWVASRT